MQSLVKTTLLCLISLAFNNAYGQGKQTIDLGPNEPLISDASRLKITLNVDIENFEEGNESAATHIYFTAEDKNNIYIARQTPVKDFQIEIEAGAKIIWKGASFNRGKVKMQNYNKEDLGAKKLFGRGEFGRQFIFGLRKKLSRELSEGDIEKYSLSFKTRLNGETKEHKIDPKIRIRVH